MRISGFTTTRPEMANTRTFKDFSEFLGGFFAEVKSRELLEPLQTHMLSRTNWGISSQA